MSSKKSNVTQNSSDGGICSRFCWEIRQLPFFGLQEPNGTTLDVEQSFAPPGLWRTLIRLAFFSGNLGALLYDLITYPSENRFIFMGYLTHWTWVLIILYQFIVLSLSACCRPTPTTASGPVKLAWIVYSMAAPASLVVFILYWGLEFEPGDEVGFLNVLKHGLVTLMILFDGLGIGLIPVRIKHYVAFFLYALAYLAWSYIHASLEIGNGSFSDDALYDSLRWNNQFASSAALSIFVMLVLVPASYLVVWLLSLVSTCNLSGSRRPTLSTGNSSSTHNSYQSMA